MMHGTTNIKNLISLLNVSAFFAIFRDVFNKDKHNNVLVLFLLHAGENTSTYYISFFTKTCELWNSPYLKERLPGIRSYLMSFLTARLADKLPGSREGIFSMWLGTDTKYE